MQSIFLWRLTSNSYTIGRWHEWTVYFKIAQNISGEFNLEYLLKINILQI
jgi:hypothetical protein